MRWLPRRFVTGPATWFVLCVLVLSVGCGGRSAPASIDDRGRSIVLRSALSYLGTPYAYGGTARSGMDCSGLVFTAFAADGHDIPRTSRGQSRVGSPIERGRVRPGDLVFFASRGGSKINHVGLVTGVDGAEVSFIHSTTRRGVVIDRLDTGYWRDRYVAARRYDQLAMN